MFVIRETFTAKPGSASKLAAQFKDVMGDIAGARASVRVLTDYIGPFNTVVLETEVTSLSEFDQMMAEYMSRPDIRERMRGYADLYLAGRREIYKVV
jgi:hypothetical protein